MENVYDVLRWRGPVNNSDGQECVNHYHHRNALRRNYCSPFGRGIRYMLEGWAKHAEVFRREYDCSIGTDGVLGDVWAKIGRELKWMLDGDVGGFDCGSLNQNIGDLLEYEGFDRERSA